MGWLGGTYIDSLVHMRINYNLWVLGVLGYSADLDNTLWLYSQVSEGARCRSIGKSGSLTGRFRDIVT